MTINLDRLKAIMEHMKREHPDQTDGQLSIMAVNAYVRELHHEERLRSQLPSAADLDAVSKEQEIKQKTS